MLSCYVHAQAYNNFLSGSLSSQLDYTLKVTVVVSAMLTAVDIQGADLRKSLALFFFHTLFLSGMISLLFVKMLLIYLLSSTTIIKKNCHREGAWKKLVTATLSWLSFIPNMLSHLALLSRLIGNQWKEVPRFWLGLLWQFVTYVQAFCVVLDCTLTDSHSSPNVMSVQVSCL